MERKLLGNLEKGLLFIVSAPAGTGKNTLVDMLLEEFDCIEESISVTTRAPRQGEINNKHYSFISEEEFLEKIDNNEFLEHAKVFDNYYGTDKKVVEKIQDKKKHAVLVIDTQGAMKLKGKIDAIFIFLMPPSMETLQERLLKRSTETKEVMDKRISWAKEEIKIFKNYDYLIINEDIQVAYNVLRSVFISEEHRIRKSNN